MSKTLFKLIALIAGLSFICTACDDNDNVDPVNKDHGLIVDKIYNYHDDLIAEYFYNPDNKLTKIAIQDPQNKRNHQDEFEYESGKLKKIIRTDFTYGINYETVIYYNSQGNISNDQIIQGNVVVEERNYAYYPNGQLKGTINKDGKENYRFVYDSNNNVVQLKGIYKDPELGTETEYTHSFEYDNKLKPDFGLDNNIFLYEPLPYWGTEALFEKNGSYNNMKKAVNSGTIWLYEYNEHGLPSKIETKWKNYDSSKDPMIIKITYKKRR